ncbi:MAG: hypothetical protein IKF96_00375 [Eggerthellaceae bacterium]|nr:hypothetical protein [Eggerthellaceae bacterium]
MMAESGGQTDGARRGMSFAEYAAGLDVSRKAESAAERYLSEDAREETAGLERDSFERMVRDRANVRSIRDSRRICKRCTFCGRCKRGKKRRPQVD